MFKTSEPIKVIHLQKFANQLILNGPFVIGIVSNSFSESKEHFNGKKIEIWAVKNIFPLDFIKYLSYLEVQKSSKVVNDQIPSSLF